MAYCSDYIFKEVRQEQTCNYSINDNYIICIILVIVLVVVVIHVNVVHTVMTDMCVSKR